MTDRNRLAQFQQRIHDVIPLTEAMAIELCQYDGRRLLVTAPLEPNRNHQGTGFGGSVYSLGVLAAWGLVELVTDDHDLGGNVVIQQGSMDYRAPADGRMFALCELPPEAELAKFFKTLARSGRGRLNLNSRVYCGEPTLVPVSEPVATFEGRFVVQRDTRPA